MDLLQTIELEEVGSDELAKFELRQAARAVLFDKEQKIALLYVSKLGYHKLPGGGVEKGEDLLAALKRECLEETGCEILIKEPLGLIVEHRKRFNLKQESYCYIAEVSGEKGIPNFDQGEKDEGFQLQWVDLAKAIDLLTKEAPADYEGNFIVKRDWAYLIAAKRLLDSK